VNPYVFIAAAIGACRYGIENELEPASSYEGYAWADPDLPTIPTSLTEARDLFRASNVGRDVLGETVHEHLAVLADEELAAFERDGADWPDEEVSQWELRRYLERV